MKTHNIEAASRRLLISAYNRSCKLEPSACAYEFTQFCIKESIVAKRKPLPGQALKDWATGSPVPLWGAIGAYTILKLLKYTPKSPEEEQAFKDVELHIQSKEGAN